MMPNLHQIRSTTLSGGNCCQFIATIHVPFFLISGLFYVPKHALFGSFKSNTLESSTLFISHRNIFSKVQKLSETFGKSGNLDMKISRISLRKSWQV